MQTINNRIEIVLKETGMTKTAFAASLNVSQQYVSKLVKTGNPSDLLIEDICQKYNINEKWLRTGDGDMHILNNPDDRFASNIGKLQRTDNDTIIRWVNIIAETNPDVLKEIEQFMKKILNIE